MVLEMTITSIKGLSNGKINSIKTPNLSTAPNLLKQEQNLMAAV